LTKGKVEFTLNEKVGRHEIPRYFVRINVETKEVEVQALSRKTELNIGKLELIGGSDAN